MEVRLGGLDLQSRVRFLARLAGLSCRHRPRRAETLTAVVGESAGLQVKRGAKSFAHWQAPFSANSGHKAAEVHPEVLLKRQLRNE